MKTITETFSLKLDKDRFCHVTARNYNKHIIDFGISNQLYLTVDELRKVAEHLLITAKKIESDKLLTP